MNTAPKHRSRNLHKGRASIKDTYYHIIICTHQRQKILMTAQLHQLSSKHSTGSKQRTAKHVYVSW